MSLWPESVYIHRGNHEEPIPDSPTHHFFFSGNRTRRWKGPTISTAYPCDQGEFQDFWLLIGWSILHFGSTALFLWAVGGWHPWVNFPSLPEGIDFLGSERIDSATKFMPQVWVKFLNCSSPKRWVSLVQDRLLNMDYHCGGFYEEVATLATARAGTGFWGLTVLTQLGCAAVMVGLPY